MARNLTRKMDEIEQLSMDGLKGQAKLGLKNFEKHWGKLHTDSDMVCYLAGEHERECYNACQQIARRYYQALEEIEEPNEQQISSKNMEMAPLKLEPLKIPTFKGSCEKLADIQRFIRMCNN